MMKERIDYLEKTVFQVQKELRTLRNIMYYLAGILTVNLGLSVW